MTPAPIPGLTRTKQWAYNSAVALKHAALLALIGTTLLTVLLAVGFIRDFSAFLSGAIAAMAFIEIGNSFAGKPEFGSIPVRVSQSTVLILDETSDLQDPARRRF
jgi:hypothetical protein